MLKRLPVLFLLVLASFFSAAQDDGSTKKKIKKAEKVKEAQVKRQKKAEIEGRKRHESIQTKDTKKRMRKHKRGPIHVKPYDKRTFFLKRWFSKKEQGG